MSPACDTAGQLWKFGYCKLIGDIFSLTDACSLIILSLFIENLQTETWSRDQKLAFKFSKCNSKISRPGHLKMQPLNLDAPVPITN